MRWANHQLTSGSLVYAATGNATAAGLAMVGALVPDSVELPLQGLVKHRGLSHWPYPYLAAAAVLAAASLFAGPLAWALAFLPLGAVLHLAADALSPGGIPWGKPSGPRFGLNLYRPFAASETLVALVWAAVCLGVCAWRGFFTVSYVVVEGERALLLATLLGRALGVGA